MGTSAFVTCHANCRQRKAYSYEYTQIYQCGEPYTPMKPIIEGMGMDWASQFTKLKQRFQTSIVKITMQLPGDNQRRDIICLALRKLAGWLHTISPSRKVSPKWLYLRLAVGVVISQPL
ncbi:TPA: phage antirepressor N-terminal domain-containing protein [Salmonella enterica subsp. enterica serovar Lexington]